MDPQINDNHIPSSLEDTCGTSYGERKLSSYNWLSDIPVSIQQQKYVEVHFKNTRKDIFLNDSDLSLKEGDLVVVEGSPGHDVGTVSLTGALVERRIMAMGNRFRPNEIKRIYRMAKENDLERYQAAKAREYDTMIQSREIAASLNLDMKIGDVEFQGDGSKAIFYYIADERVDFRQLIKVLAETFRIRIEMKQIGVRQEAGRIGGIGPCGRALCCSEWLTSFKSVNTSAARIQELTMNPQMLTGQCGKLKCCTNFEVNTYLEARKNLPSPDHRLETAQGTFKLLKTDVLAGQLTYVQEDKTLGGVETISLKRAHEILKQNRQGEKPQTLQREQEAMPMSKPKDILADSISRFDNNKENSGKNSNRRRSNKNRRQQRNASNRGQRNNRAEQPNFQQKTERRGKSTAQDKSTNEGSAPRPNKRVRPNRRPNQSRRKGRSDNQKESTPTAQ